MKRTGHRPDVDFPGSVAALHLTPKDRRGTVPDGLEDRSCLLCGCDMREFALSLKRLGLAGAALALSAFAQPAFAANWLELNFGLFGPSYDGRVKGCEK